MKIPLVFHFLLAAWPRFRARRRAQTRLDTAMAHNAYAIERTKRACRGMKRAPAIDVAAGAIRLLRKEGRDGRR